MRPDSFYNGYKTGTMMLEDCLGRFESFDEFEKKFPQEFLNDDFRVGDYLYELWEKHGKETISVLSERAWQDVSYLRKVINNRWEKSKAPKTPKRDALLCFCIAMGATLEEIQCLLKYAGYPPLYVRRRRDVIIWYGIMQNEDVPTIDTNLRNRKLTPLISDEKLGL